ncbi:MAG: DUF2383 domain-containing protein [Terracidiphilus sp.]|jgi:uncharacterized protein (TIGR02284 family)
MKQQCSTQPDQCASAIYTVIQSLIDSQEALVEVGEKLEDADLKRFFLAESLRRAEFRGELESILNQEGVGNLLEGETEPGPVRRVLAELRLRSHEAGGHRLLATAEQGEDAAREAYSRAIKTFPPTPILQLLSSQAAHIEESRDFVKAARESAAFELSARDRAA